MLLSAQSIWHLLFVLRFCVLADFFFSTADKKLPPTDPAFCYFWFVQSACMSSCRCCLLGVVSLFLSMPLESKCLSLFLFQGVCFDIPVGELSNIQVCFL